MTNAHDEATNGVGPDHRPEPEATPGTLGTVETAGSGSQARGPFDLNGTQKRVLVAVLIVHLILARFTWRDLRHRPAASVRGPKRVWRVWATVNTTGSLAYWLVGRRRGSTAPPV